MVRDAHRLLGDVHRLVPDPLQVGVDLHGRGDEPEVGGHRLLEGEQAQAALVDLDLQIVDVLVRGDDALRRIDAALDEGVGGVVHALLDERAHVQQAVLERLHLLFEMMPLEMAALVTRSTFLHRVLFIRTGP